MIDHIVCRVGPKDNFTLQAPAGDTVHNVGVYRPDDATVRQNALDICRAHGLKPPAMALDLLHLALAVHATDSLVYRAGAYDSWTRALHLYLPVSDVSRWEGIHAVIVDMLSFLSGDHWELDLRPASWDMPADPTEDTTPKVVPSLVSLFSGGMDSFVGAIDLLESGSFIALAGHHGAGTTNKAQEQVHAVLEKHYPSRTTFLPFHSQSFLPGHREAEKTTRSRSLLFLAIGTLAASGFGGLPLVVPENGLISLNTPLTNSRMGSLSTRTTHSFFLTQFDRVLRHLDIPVTLQTPYRFMTKGEMANMVKSITAFAEGVRLTVSCSHPDVGRYEGSSPGQHCGYCVPCIIRRAALHAAGLDNPAHYLLDVRKEAPPSTSKKARDPRAFHMAAIRFEAKKRGEIITDVVSTGPLPADEIADFNDVYRRGMREIAAFLKST